MINITHVVDISHSSVYWCIGLTVRGLFNGMASFKKHVAKSK